MHFDSFKATPDTKSPGLRENPEIRTGFGPPESRFWTLFCGRGDIRSPAARGDIYPLRPLASVHDNSRYRASWPGEIQVKQ